MAATTWDIVIIIKIINILVSASLASYNISSLSSYHFFLHIVLATLFYMNDHGDEALQVDHLMWAGTGYEIWQQQHWTDDIHVTRGRLY